VICLDRGRLQPMCGIENPTALTINLALVDCPLCHLMFERVPVVPGEELPLRHATPYGVDPTLHYAGPFIADGLTTMPEFAHEHRRRPTRRVRLAIGVLIGVVLALLLLAGMASVAGADDGDLPGTPAPDGTSNVQEPTQPTPSVAPFIPPPRPPSGDDD
jgi:hypothetical protein